MPKVTIKKLKETLIDICNDIPSLKKEGLYRNPFSCCCGAVEIGDFDDLCSTVTDLLNPPFDSKFYTIDRKGQINVLSAVIECVVEHIIEEEDRVVVATTASSDNGDIIYSRLPDSIDQLAAAKALKKLKFKPFDGGINESSNKRITVWVRKRG